MTVQYLDSTHVKEILVAQTNTIARSLHDVGLAAWFGGSLMGVVGVNKSAAAVTSPDQRVRVASAAWAAWTPVNAAAIAIHSVGGVLLVANNKGRLTGQRGVLAWTVGKGALTVAAMAATGYSRVLGQKIMNAGDVPVDDGVTPDSATPVDVADAQRQLKVLQYAIPALTGGILIASAQMGEQQRPTSVAQGLFNRLMPEKLAA